MQSLTFYVYDITCPFSERSRGEVQTSGFLAKECVCAVAGVKGGLKGSKNIIPDW